MNIQPIVEGHGEVSALPVLLRRLRDAAQTYELDVGRPIRRKRSQLVKKPLLQDAVKLALKQPQCRAIVILFDADDDCPKDLTARLQEWAAEAAGLVPCGVVMATREYEAWFLGAIESLQGRRGIRGDAAFPGDPEAVRDAKGKLEERMDAPCSYFETTDQPALSALFDMKVAFQRCRSFRKLVTCFGQIAARAGATVSTWPPPDWIRGVG
jgi:hypothetical protein